MPGEMTKEAVRAWKAGWERVNQIELDELGRLTPEERLRQFESLVELSKAMGWDEQLAAEDEVVRNRWVRLKRMASG